MPIAATGIFSTAHRLKLMLAASATVQSLLESASEAEALEKITTYAGEDLSWPRCLVEDEPVTFERVDVSYASSERRVNFYLEFYIDSDAGASSIGDEHNWAMDQLGGVCSDIFELAGTGEPIAGSTHLNIDTLTLTRVDRASADERPDIDTERSDDALWLAVFNATIMQ